jgi:predicted component of type VI protein secretion system
MQVRLKILHGTLKNKRGETTSPEVAIHKRRFLIGSAPDCSMRCPSKSVNPHHCEILSDARTVAIRVLPGKSTTLLNQQQVTEPRVLKHGDHLRIGRLEFEVLIDQQAPSLESPSPDTASASSEDEGDSISEMLSAADLREREHRVLDPESRQFHLPETPHHKASDDQESDATPTRPKKKQPPRKLPKPPPTPFDNAEDSTEAAEEALRKLFSR